MTAYGFSEDDAKRIGKSVRLTERLLGKDDLSGVQSERGGIGVRVMLGQHNSAAWTKHTPKTITIYGGYPTTADSRPTQSAYTVAAHNVFVDITTGATARWVAVSCNGFGWYLIAAEC